jgi:tetratricopeptide (TPR) repeat protein
MIRKAAISVTIYLIAVAGFAQTLARNDELKFDGDYYLMRKEFDKALKLYLDVLKTEPANADIKHRIGICYLYSENEKAKAIPYLEEAGEKVSLRYKTNSFKETNAPIETLFLLGSAYRVNNEFDKAIAAYTRYKDYLDKNDKYNREVTDLYIRNCKLARELQRYPIHVTMTNLGNKLNNELPNFNAVVSGDGKTIAFSTPGKQGYEIFLSNYGDSGWTAPKNITSMLGTGKYLKTCDLSNDGQTMLLVMEDPENSDIYISNYNKGRWSKAVAIGKEINSKSNETHACLTADNKFIYFTSDRKGGTGDLDIYRSTRDPSGKWGKPVNLGPLVNTPYNEETPFVSNDGNTLYFSSEGHDGIGGFDIFRYDLNSANAHSINMGYPLNTTDNNLFYYPFGDGNKAYYSVAGDDSYGGRDIYLVELKPDSREEQETAITAAIAAVKAEEEKEEEQIVKVREEEKEVVKVEEEVVNVIKGEEEVKEVAKVEEEVTDVEMTGKEETEVAVERESLPVAEVTNEMRPADEMVTGNVKSYVVQFMALRHPVDLTYFTGLSDIFVTYSEDKWYRYQWRATTDAAEAEKIKDELVDRGFGDTFIRKKNIVPNYTIQFMAVPGPVVNLTQFNGITSVSVSKGKDKFCRYTTGEFETRSEAMAQLDYVKQSGYRKAFVRKVKILQ